MKIFNRMHRAILLLMIGLAGTALAQKPNFTLTGVMSSGDSTNAYIEGSLYTTGDALPSGFRIQEIREHGITVSDPAGKNLYYVPVGTSGDIEKLDQEITEKQIEEVPENVGTVSFISASEAEDDSSGFDFDFETGAKAVLAVALLLVGFLLSFIGQIWYLVACFKTSIWWGLGALFIPFVELIFLFMHWEDAKRPFLLSLTGALMAYAGIFMMPGMLDVF